MSNTYTTDIVAVPLLTGGFSYLGSKYILMNQGQVSVGSMALDKNVSFALMNTAGALISNLTKDYIIPKIPNSSIPQGAKRIVEASIGPAICGGSGLLLEKMLESGDNTVAGLFNGTQNQASSISNFFVGAASYVGAQYTNDMLFKKQQ